MSVSVGFSRVVVAVSADSGAGAFAAAADMARLLRAELAGLYIEDETIFGIAEMPFSTEIALAGVLRPMHRQDLETAYRAAAGAMRRRLEAVAGHAHLRHSFARERGSVQGIVEHSARVGDIVVFVEPERALDRACVVAARVLAAAITSPSSLLYVPRGASAWSGGVVAVIDGEAGTEVLAASVLLAAASRAALTVISDAPPARLAGEIAQMAAAHELAPPATEIRKPAGGLAAILAGPFDDCLLVIERGHAGIASAGELRTLAARRRAPVLLVERAHRAV